MWCIHIAGRNALKGTVQRKLRLSKAIPINRCGLWLPGIFFKSFFLLRVHNGMRESAFIFVHLIMARGLWPLQITGPFSSRKYGKMIQHDWTIYGWVSYYQLFTMGPWGYEKATLFCLRTLKTVFCNFKDESLLSFKNEISAVQCLQRVYQLVQISTPVSSR